MKAIMNWLWSKYNGMLRGALIAKLMKIVSNEQEWISNHGNAPPNFSQISCHLEVIQWSFSHLCLAFFGYELTSFWQTDSQTKTHFYSVWYYLFTYLLQVLVLGTFTRFCHMKAVWSFNLFDYKLYVPGLCNP